MTPTGSQNSNNELLKAINTLSKAVEGISKSLAGIGASSQRRTSPDRAQAKAQNPYLRPKRHADAEYERNKRLAKLQEKSTLELIGGLSLFSKTVNILSSTSNKSQRALKQNLKQQNEYTKFILEHEKMSSKYQDKVAQQMQSLLKSSSTFKNIRLQGTTPGARAKELSGIQESLQNVIAKASSLTQKNGVKNVSQLDLKDMRKLAGDMTASGIHLSGTKSSDPKEALKEIEGSYDDKIAKKKKAIEDVYKSGANPGRLKKLNDDIVKLEQEKRNKLGSALEKGMTEAQKFNKELANSTNKNFLFSVATDKAESAVKKLGASGLTLTGAFELLVNASKIYYNSMITLAKQQMGGAFWDVSLSALSLNASFDSTIKFLKTFGMQVSQIGIKGMVKSFKDNEENFHKMGMFGDDALEGYTHAASAFLEMGISPKDEKRFNSAMKNYTDNVNEMAKLTGTSAKDLMVMDKELASTHDSQSMMMKLGVEERGIKMQSIIAERNRIKLMGQTDQEAQRFIQTLQALNAQSPEKRIENSMKSMQLMSMVGMGSDASKLSQILLKRDDQLTSDEQKFKTDTLMELGKRVNQLKGTGMSNEMVINKLMEGQPESMRKAIEEAAIANLNKENKGEVDKNSKNAKETSENYQIGWANAKLGEVGAMMKSFVTNPLIEVLTAIAAAVAIIAFRKEIKQGFGKVAEKFGKGGGGPTPPGGPGSGPNVPAGPAEKIEKAVGESAKTVGTQAAGAATDAASTAAKDGAKVAEKEGAKAAGKTGAKAVGKSLLKKIPIIGALGGLMFAGSRAMAGDWTGAGLELASGVAGTVPGLGTAASLGIDAALMARDIHNANQEVNADAIPSEQNQSSVKPVNFADNATNSFMPANRETPAINNGISSVDDKSKKDALTQLIDLLVGAQNIEQAKLDELIALLKTLIDTVKPENNGLLDALRSNSSKISFNELQSKSTLFALK